MAIPPIVYSPHLNEMFDDYFRMTFAEFIALDFTEKHSWQDDCLKNELLSDQIPAMRAGYCEWATHARSRPVSVGWAWFESADRHVKLAPGGISSNIMLISHKGYDLGMLRTSALLESWLPDMDWQQRALYSQAKAFLPTGLNDHR